MVSYLSNTPQNEEVIWPSVLLQYNQYPHASWWHWATGYKALPLEFIKEPEDPLYESLKPLVEENLDLYINQITNEGTGREYL